MAAQLERPGTQTDMITLSASLARARTNGREKPQLSCNFCRKRKLRCDRKQPCESCIRLGQASACRFALSQAPRAHAKQPNGSGTQDTLQARIDHLESLVRSLASKAQDQTPPSTCGSALPVEAPAFARYNDPIAHRYGRIDLQAHKSSYVESNHWTAILDEISDLKDMLSDQGDVFLDEDRTEQQLLPGIDLFTYQSYPCTKMDVLAALPPRNLVDSIIAKYFKSADMPISLVIHRRVFFKQYNSFWEDPHGTPITWITILFGIMFMVAHCTLFIDGGVDQLDQETLVEYQNIAMVYREKMIQCLRMGNYMKGSLHTIEALLFFLQVEYIQGEDTQQGCWQLIGVIIRVALKMGYHRDGSHFPEMSFFEAEMRRRTWYILMQFDTASASQAGLPRLIKQAQCDTAEPRNLLDDDFDDTTRNAPSERPQNEHTLCQFLIFKSRVVSAYGMICDFTTSSQQRNYDEAIRLDSVLNAAYAQKPPILELKPMHQSLLDGAELITRRIYIAAAFHHTQMTLHRKFMILAKTNGRYTRSHKICIDAALAILHLQADIIEQCKPGRMLHASRWKVMLLMQSELLLATTVLCLNLADDATKAPPEKPDEVNRNSIAALKSSRAIWKQQKPFSKEAQMAIKVIDSVLTGTQSTAAAAQPLETALEFQPIDEFCWSTWSSKFYQEGDVVSSGVLADMGEDLGINTGDGFFDLNNGWETWF